MSEPTRGYPIAIIGMHRSGTSLITRLLEEQGLFLGGRKDKHDEALFFIKLNDWLLHQSGCSWDNPDRFRHLIEDAQLNPLVTDYLRLSVDSPRAVGFLGFSRYLKWRSLSAIAEPWGWKDPRTTITLPLWENVFPGLRVIHVLRHGVDVAQSLLVRRNRKIALAEKRFQRLRTIHRFLGKSQGFTDSVRCRTLAEGFSLWESYVTSAENLTEELGSRAITVRYEDFLADPENWARRLIDFCGLTIDPARFDRRLEGINPERAFAFRKSPELTDFARSVASRLETKSYSGE